MPRCAGGAAALLPRMLRTWRDFTLNGLAGTLYAALPALMIGLLGLPAARLCVATRTRGRRVVLLLYAAACLGGLGLLALAWDLGRIAGFTTLTALLTVACVVRPDANAPGAARVGLVAAAFFVAVLYALLPVADLYFDYGRVLNLARLRPVCRPCAETGVALIDVFNRHQPLPVRARLDTDPALGNVPRAVVLLAPSTCRAGRSMCHRPYQRPNGMGGRVV